MSPKTILLLAVLLLASCNPLRKVQRNQKADSTVVDRSEIHKTVTDILRESGTFTQTVVEFYPPVAASEPPKADNGVALPPQEPPKPQPPAVKRIVRTEIAAEREHETTTDSELSEKMAEKPPAATMTIKWIAITLAAVAAIILLLKFPKIKL